MCVLSGGMAIKTRKHALNQGYKELKVLLDHFEFNCDQINTYSPLQHQPLFSMGVVTRDPCILYTKLF